MRFYKRSGGMSAASELLVLAYHLPSGEIMLSVASGCLYVGIRRVLQRTRSEQMLSITGCNCRSITSRNNGNVVT